MGLLDFDKIIIVDDEETGAEISLSAVDDLGIDTRLITTGKYQKVDQLLAEVMKDHVNIGVLCDHKLMPGALASFYGSELVAALYKQNVPAILVTQYTEYEMDTSIREFRRWMPALITRKKLSEENVKKAFGFCADELSGAIPASRLPHRTLIEIISSKKDDEADVAEAMIRGWNPDERVGFPMALIPEAIKNNVLQTLKSKCRAFVFAEVNIGASRSSELYFDSFEWAEKPSGLTIDSLFTKS
ncbi:CheY-like chemotaxis protein [Hymenobacter sp. UYAg731]